MKFLSIIMFIMIVMLAGCQQKQPEIRVVKYSQKQSIPQNNPPEALSVGKKGGSIANTLKDGAPEGPLPVTFEKVTPVAEPMSRYGNPGEYRVNGQTYEVMTTASGYRAQGLASWYGTKFHAKRTSSGEEYDLYGMTAAHKTLPLPTYVKVTNLSNGREAVVKVNDRGPFHKDRIIDLSYGAAVKLGLLPKGTAPVEIEALTVKNSKNHKAFYYLQAGAFSTEKLAQTLLAKLTKLTPSPIFIERYKEFFIVKAGPFANKQMSDDLKIILTKNGVSGAFSVLQ